MRLGEFDRYIRIIKPIVTIDSFGQESSEWETFYEGWASKYTKMSDERYESNQKVNIETTIFSIHYEKGVKSTFKLIDVDEEIAYDILGVKEVGYKEGLQIYTKTKDNYDF
jgi:head-tail adaptor